MQFITSLSSYISSYEFGGKGAKPAVKGLYGNKKVSIKKEDSLPRQHLTLPQLSKHEGKFFIWI